MTSLNRFWRPALVALAALLAVAPALAQDEASEWSALIYSQEQQTLVRVGVDGELATYELELGPDVALQGRHIAVWPDGDRVAYCAVRYGDTTEATLTVRDLPGGENLLEVDFPEASDCRVTQASLSDDATRLAVALFHYFPADTEAAAEVNAPPWQLVVIDAETGDILHTLEAGEAVAETDIVSEQAIIAETRDFDGETVIFYAMPYAVGGMTSYPAYRWNLNDGTLELESEQAVYNAATLADTGERVYAAQDESLPFGLADSPIPPANVVLYENGEGEPDIIYHSPDWLITDVDFIENGQRIAITQAPAAEQTTTAFTVTSRAIALSRDGSTESLMTTEGNLQVAGAPGGYIALLSTTDLTGPNRLLYGSGGQTTTLWQTTGEWWELVWSAPLPTPPDLPPFAVWEE